MRSIKSRMVFVSLFKVTEKVTFPKDDYYSVFCIFLVCKKLDPEGSFWRFLKSFDGFFTFLGRYCYHRRRTNNN